MTLLSPDVLKRALAEAAAGEFGTILEKLPIGGALKLHKSEWTRREPCYHYYWRTSGGTIKVKRIDGDYYLIRKA